MLAINSVDSHLAAARVGADTTRESARGPCSPSVNLAMDRARAVVAVDNGGCVGANRTTVLGLGHRTSLGVSARTTRLAAHGTSVVIRNVPITNDAVDGTGELVAVLRTGAGGTGFSGERRFGQNTSASFDTTTAGERAFSPGTPRADNAIFGASEAVAVRNIRSRSASLATVLRLLESTGASLGTTGATGVSARAPGTPCVFDTVHRAFERVASHLNCFSESKSVGRAVRFDANSVRVSSALYTTIFRVSNRTGRGLESAAAGFAAITVNTEIARYTINGACEFVAGTGV